MSHQQLTPQPAQKGLSVWQALIFIGIAMLVTMLATFFVIKMFLFPAPFTPVVLSDKEQQAFTAKLSRLDRPNTTPATSSSQEPLSGERDAGGRLIPEKYTEEEADREIFFSERELNAVLARNTDLADKVAFDLAEDMISVKLLIPLDPDLPLFGGRNFKARAGAEIAYREGRPVVKLVGLSLMGMPMPNSWLGGMKNVDLVKEFGNEQGFWKAFADGVESLSVVDGALRLKLRE